MILRSDRAVRSLVAGSPTTSTTNGRFKCSAPLIRPTPFYCLYLSLVVRKRPGQRGIFPDVRNNRSLTRTDLPTFYAIIFLALLRPQEERALVRLPDPDIRFLRLIVVFAVLRLFEPGRLRLPPPLHSHLAEPHEAQY